MAAKFKNAPAARAPAVLKRQEACQRNLVELKSQVAETVLAAIEGAPDGQSNLATLHAQIELATFERDGNALAHDLAKRLDAEAIAAWKAELQDLPPDQLVDGIDKTKCCRACSAELGCVITAFGPCGHPIRGMTALPAKWASHPTIRPTFQAATDKVQRATRASR